MGGQINEALQSLITSARNGNPAAAGNGAVPGAPLIDAVVQPALAGVGNIVNAGGNVARGGNINNAGGGIPILGEVGSLVQNVLSGVGGLNNQADQRYAPQLEQLANMGFADREANLRALQAAT